MVLQQIGHPGKKQQQPPLLEASRRGDVKWNNAISWHERTLESCSSVYCARKGSSSAGRELAFAPDGIPASTLA